MTLERLTGRMSSYSFVPPADTEEFAALAGKLGKLFARQEQDGRGSLLYRTELHRGRP